jgi:SAM-dependent methyltransferase
MANSICAPALITRPNFKEREVSSLRERPAEVQAQETATEPTTRSTKRLREHYLVERELSDQLRAASREARLKLYSRLYDDLYRRVPDPQLTAKSSAEQWRARVHEQVLFLAPYLSPGTCYLEIGAGDCALAVELATRVRHVWALDVSASITSGLRFPDNFDLVISDGCSIPVPPESIDLAYSNQLMEHLHVDDALEQLRNIHRVLRPGGRYVCVTPNALLGPHDISRHFDPVPTGFHLKEYLVGELARLFRSAGFSSTRAIVGAKGRFVESPPVAVSLIENLLLALPRSVRSPVARSRILRWMFCGRFVATR